MSYYYMKEIWWNPLRIFGIKFFKAEGHIFIKIRNGKRRKIK